MVVTTQNPAPSLRNIEVIVWHVLFTLLTRIYTVGCLLIRENIQVFICDKQSVKEKENERQGEEG